MKIWKQKDKEKWVHLTKEKLKSSNSQKHYKQDQKDSSQT